MPTKTKIEWADYISNPLKAVLVDGKRGHACVKVSEGCAHCWASSFNVRLGTGLAYTRPNLEIVEVYLDEAELARLEGFRPKGFFKNGRERALVFPCDMTDLFGDWVPVDFVKRIFGAFEARRDVDFLVLTKRPGRMLDFVAGSIPLQNVILGTSVENQARADERRDAMHELQRRGWRIAVSYEPALQLVHWDEWYFTELLIAGGESGNQARPTSLDAMRTARDFCQEFGIKFFFKQWGEWAPVVDMVERGITTFKNRPVDGMAKVGKGLAGHVLDGIEWREMP